MTGKDSYTVVPLKKQTTKNKTRGPEHISSTSKRVNVDGSINASNLILTRLNNAMQQNKQLYQTLTTVDLIKEKRLYLN